MVSPARLPSSARSIAAAVAALTIAATLLLMLGLGSPATAQAELPSYPDPITGIDVTRLTFEGPDTDGVQCISRIGGLSNGAVSWSLDSSQITFAKSCPAATARNGIYLLDVATGEQHCLIGTYRNIWASPTFDHTDGKIYYIDLAAQTREAAFGIYTVDVPANPSNGDDCPAVGSRRLLLNLDGSKSPARERFTLSKNAARADQNGAVANAWFAVHAEDEDGASGQVGARTLIFNAAGNFHPNWTRSDSANPVQWTYVDDGDSSIWSTDDPLKIYTNRGDGNGNNITAVWNINQRANPLFLPFGTGDCAGDGAQVAHSDWIHHPSTNTDVFIGSGDTRCLWTRQVTNGQVIVEQNSIGLNGYLHINANPASIGGTVDDIEFVADTYDLRGGPGGNTPQPGVPEYAPMLYRVTLNDLRPSVNDNWAELVGRPENKLAWHRNNMMYGADVQAVGVDLSGFKPYEPHPQYSPDGRYVLWQSSSLLADSDFPSYRCTASACGREGGYGVPFSSGVLWSDLYVVDQGGPIDPDPTPTPEPTPTPAGGPASIELNDLDDATDWTSWATRGVFDGATVGNDGVTFDYSVEDTGYVAARTRILATNDWRTYQSLDITYRGQNSGGEVLVLIRRGTVSARLTTTFVDDGTGARRISLPLTDFGDPATMGNISEIAIEFDETSPNPFELLDLRLVGDDDGAAAFACAVDAGAVTWTDAGQSKYWIYKSTDNGNTYNWLGRTVGNPASTAFTDPAPTIGARYQVHYQGIPRVDCTITAEPSANGPAFTCVVDAGVATWTDADQSKYWIYKSTDNGNTYNWLGRTAGNPAPTSFTDRAPTIGARYQVHYAGIPRVDCTITDEPSANGAPFVCNANGAAISWTDADQSKYWIYKSTDGGNTYNWLGRTAGNPAPTSFTDSAPSAGARYQVHYQGIPRVGCTIG